MPTTPPQRCRTYTARTRDHEQLRMVRLLLYWYRQSRITRLPTRRPPPLLPVGGNGLRKGYRSRRHRPDSSRHRSDNPFPAAPTPRNPELAELLTDCDSDADPYYANNCGQIPLHRVGRLGKRLGINSASGKGRNRA
ncbi:unnamed protein product [Tuber melanosporum]|uniref:(Perigord truffle) hypothetical protein n=1 Tax=Tuber melanosporum (strain Mel28) TaxID=656061 RepID=D5G861_TUBMM|nr:uncharacterized protein GSTUM_00002845001 [Tuber melanosporum]CAZ80704.1 unnamed protein product [Tuber melanosporum]